MYTIPSLMSRINQLSAALNKLSVRAFTGEEKLMVSDGIFHSRLTNFVRQFEHKIKDYGYNELQRFCAGRHTKEITRTEAL